MPARRRDCNRQSAKRVKQRHEDQVTELKAQVAVMRAGNAGLQSRLASERAEHAHNGAGGTARQACALCLRFAEDSIFPGSARHACRSPRQRLIAPRRRCTRRAVDAAGL